ncbi:MAG: hypothetical protein NT075_01100 [Chloroflexi bacterium]|nr:hypothetical protein [Chloroflexota bacterium]
MLKRTSLFLLILTHLLYLAALVPWYVLAQLTYSSYDPVAAAEDQMRQLFFYTIMLAPLAPLLAILLSWISFGRRKYGWAILWTLLPLLLASPAALYLYYMWRRGF